MPVYSIETSYHLPIFRQAAFEAHSLEEACRLALESDDWSDEKADYDCAGETYVSGIWLGPEAYKGQSLPVPTRFDENILRRANHFSEMLAFLKEAARPRRPGTEPWLSRVEAAIRKAEAILSDAPDPDEALHLSANLASPP
jgi:hypothetical protein